MFEILKVDSLCFSSGTMAPNISNKLHLGKNIVDFMLRQHADGEKALILDLKKQSKVYSYSNIYSAFRSCLKPIITGASNRKTYLPPMTTAYHLFLCMNN